MKTRDEVYGIEYIWHLFQQHEPAELRMCAQVCVCTRARGSVCAREHFHLKQVSEPLNEGINQNKNAGLVQDPAFGEYLMEIQKRRREKKKWERRER